MRTPSQGANFHPRLSSRLRYTHYARLIFAVASLGVAIAAPSTITPLMLTPVLGDHFEPRLSPRERELTAQLLTVADIPTVSTSWTPPEGGTLLSRTVAIPMLVLDHPSSVMRDRLLLVAKQLSVLRMFTSVVAAETYPEKEVDTYLNVLHALERCTSLPSYFDFCLIFEDDAVFHPQLESALSATVASLPSVWQALHMCPGFAWGRGLPHTNSSYFHLHANNPGCEESPPAR